MEYSAMYSVSADAICQEVSGEIVILDLKSEQYFSLDPVGTRIWQLLQEKAHLEKILTTLLAEYDVEESELKADIKALLDKLSSEGLITMLEPGRE